MKKNPYLTFSLVAGAVVVGYLIYTKRRNKMAIPANVDVAKPSSSGGGGGGGASVSRGGVPPMPIITPPVIVIPPSTVSPAQPSATTPLSQTTAGAPTKTMVDNPDQDRVLGGAVVPPTSSTVQTSSGTLSVPTTLSTQPLAQSGGKAG
jgi:hypothetical protein